MPSPRSALSRVLAAATAVALGLLTTTGAAAAGSAPSESNPHRPGAGSRTASTTAEPTTSRLGGANRYATAVAVSSAIWDDGAAYGQHVYVASGENFPDALAGGPAAAAQGMPLLLVPRTGTLPTVVAKELRRLAPSYITVFGGTGAVSAGMATQLKALAGTGEVYREAGVDRYDTARILANHATTWSGSTPAYPDTVYVANGTTYADALAGGTAAALVGAPLLLTPRDRLDDSTASALAGIDPSTIVVLGGTGAVSSGVVSALKGYAPTVVRIGGVDRYDTAAKVSKATFPNADDVLEVFLTSGLGYADALAATPAAALLGDTSLLLVKPTCVPAPAHAEVVRLDPVYVTAIGRTGAVSDATLSGKGC